MKKRENPAYGGRHFTPEQSQHIVAELAVTALAQKATTEELVMLAALIPNALRIWRTGADVIVTASLRPGQHKTEKGE